MCIQLFVNNYVGSLTNELILVKLIRVVQIDPSKVLAR